MKALDICAGAGLLSYGLTLAGFDVRGVEINRDAIDTHRRHAGPCDEADVRTYHPADRFVLVAGGPPCQPFSMAGERLGLDDPRYLVPDFLRVAREAQAEVVMIENVRGLVYDVRAFRVVLDAFEAEYATTWRVLDAARFRWPLATHAPPGSLFGKPYCTVREGGGRISLKVAGFATELAPAGAAEGDDDELARVLRRGRPRDRGFPGRCDGGHARGRRGAAGALGLGPVARRQGVHVRQRREHWAEDVRRVGSRARAGLLLLGELLRAADGNRVESSQIANVAGSGHHLREALGLTGSYRHGLKEGAKPQSPQGMRMLDVDAPAHTVGVSVAELLDRPAPCITATEHKSAMNGTQPRHRRRRASERLSDALEAAGLADRPATTPEQCVALQDFPPDWTFAGNKSSQHRQIGNAVPRALARAVGVAIRDALTGGAS